MISLQLLVTAAAIIYVFHDPNKLMPLVSTVTAIPISFGDVGVRETLFQQLLGNLAHVPAAIAALAASLGFAIQASWSLLGAGAFCFRGN